jgi:hypothetical protein
MRDIKAEAERLRLGLQGGWRDIAEVVAWADDVLTSEASPPPQIVVLSLSRQQPRDGVIELLRELPGIVDRIAIMRECLGDLRLWVGQDPQRGEQVARYLYTLAGSDALPEAYFGREPFSLDDHFALARTGTYGTPEAALAYLVEWLDEQSHQR